MNPCGSGPLSFSLSREVVDDSRIVCVLKIFFKKIKFFIYFKLIFF
jgi:hypothetical protein